MALRTDLGDEAPFAARLIADAVAATRRTRNHAEIHQGSSVRGAIDTVALAAELIRLRAVGPHDPDGYATALLDAMIVALSGRIQLDDVSDSAPEQILRSIWEDLILAGAVATAPG